MSEIGDSGGIVSESELAALSELLIRYEGGDPLSPEVKTARRRFEDLVNQIYWDRVHPRFGDSITSVAFTYLVAGQCKERLAKQRPSSI
jgi:hypothetical protein